MLAVAAACAANARITSLGAPAQFGISPDPESWYDINPYTWDVFTTFDDEKIFGTNDPRQTIVSAECYSTGVVEGRKVGDFTAVASLTDRGAFFGGDGYLDLYYFAPVDIDRYAQQIVLFGGWKYNVTKYIDIDIGGNVIYSTKPVVGPGLVVEGMGGETLRGDIYVGFTSSKLYVEPFGLCRIRPDIRRTPLYGGFRPAHRPRRIDGNPRPRNRDKTYRGLYKGAKIFGQQNRNRRLLAQRLFLHSDGIKSRIPV